MDTEPLTNCYRSHQAKAGRKAMSWQGAMRGYRMALPALREMWASFRKPGGCVCPSQDQEGERPSADPCEQQARQGGQEPPAQIRVTEQQIRPRTHDKGKTKEEYQRKEQLSHHVPFWMPLALAMGRKERLPAGRIALHLLYICAR